MGDLGTRSQRLRMVLRRSRNLLRTRMGMASDLEWKRNLLQEGGSRRLPERTQLYLECTQATPETLQIWVMHHSSNRRHHLYLTGHLFRLTLQPSFSLI